MGILGADNIGEIPVYQIVGHGMLGLRNYKLAGQFRFNVVIYFFKNIIQLQVFFGRKGVKVVYELIYEIRHGLAG